MTRNAGLVMFGLIAACCCLGPCNSTEDGEDPSYRFSLNGTPITPRCCSLDGDAANLKSGDVIAVEVPELGSGELLLVLRDIKTCDFVSTAQDRGRLFLRSSSGKLKTVGVVVETGHNPLSVMSPSEIGGLWGLRIGGWTEEMEMTLRYLDPKGICVDVDAGGLIKNLEQTESAVRFISDTRYLVLRNAEPAADYTSVVGYGELIFLVIRGAGIGQGGFDVQSISGNRNLRYLEVVMWGIPLINTPAFSDLGELRSLLVDGCKGVDSIGFVVPMRHLAVLQMSRTDVSSLAPLSDSRSIRKIDASMTDLVDLPDGGLPALRMINVIGSKIGGEAIEHFRQTHPVCIVHYSWLDSLQAAVGHTDRLRVVPGFADHPARVLFETADANVIRELADGIAIDEPRSGRIYRFEGHPSLQFYQRDRLSVLLKIIPGAGIRWVDGPWPGDATLTDAGASFLTRWLENRDVSMRF